MESRKGDPSSSSNLSSFPFGLHILVVDDDPTCLKVVEKMLRICKYEVTTCEHATIALALLRDKKAGYDVVLTDVHMPDVDGFKLLEIIGLEMDLPVVMMSADCDVNVAKRGLEHGACYYLMKPISMDEIKNIWQHLVRKKKINEKEIGQIGSDGKEIGQTTSNEEDNTSKNTSEDPECASSVNEGSSKKQYKRKKQAKRDEDGSDCDEEQTVEKKPRVVWHSGLHTQFLNAVRQIGIDRAVPKKILDLMDVPGLTRENVASHLQKYRLYLRKLENEQQSQRTLSGNFPGKSKLISVPHHMMIDHQGQMGFPKFPELPYNNMGIQSGTMHNLQNLNASMPLASINPVPLHHQISQINNPSETLAFGQTASNGPSNVQPILLPGSNSLGPRKLLKQQNDMKLGFGMMPQHTKVGHSSLGDTMQMAHERIQARPGPFGSSPVDNFGLMNVQNSNSFANIRNVGLVNRSNECSPFIHTSNYSGLHLSSSGGLYGMTQTGPLGHPPSNHNSLTEIKKGIMPIEIDVKDPPLPPEFNLPDYSFDTFNKFTGPFPNAIQEPSDLLMENYSKVEGDCLADILRCSRIGNSSVPQHFDDIDLEVFKQKDGTDTMESDFDISEFQVDGSSGDDGN